MTWEFVLSLVIATIAVCISYLALRMSRAIRISGIFTDLVHQMNLINESSIRFNIAGPISVKIDVPEDKVVEFEKKSAIFLHHLNLLHIVYRNKELLGKRIVGNFERWVRSTFWPWVKKDDWLLKHWKETKTTNDCLGKDFFDWLDEVINKQNSDKQSPLQTL